MTLYFYILTSASAKDVKDVNVLPAFVC